MIRILLLSLFLWCSPAFAQTSFVIQPPRVILEFSCNDTAGVTTFMIHSQAFAGTACGASETLGVNSGGVLLPLATTFTYMRCLASAGPAAGQTWTQTLRLNGTNTALACVMTNPATTCEVGASVSASVGQIVTISHVDTDVTEGTDLRCSVIGT